MTGDPTTSGSTRARILAVAVERFGRRGVEAVSLDEIAVEVGVRKQTVLYWFSSKAELVDAVLARAAEDIVVEVEAAVRHAGDDPLQVIDAVVTSVFRLGMRRPELLGLVRDLDRLSDDERRHLRRHLDPIIERGTAYVAEQMDAGRLRRGDPGIVVVLSYATIAGVATEPVALEAVGWRPTAAGLRHLRAGLRDYLRAALAP